MSEGGARRWGWHRLSRSAAADLVATSGVGPGDLVLDLGAGDGVVTSALIDAGVRVVALELHARRAADLRARFADDGRVTVARADVTDLRLPRRRFHVVANPPFDGLSAVLRRLTSSRSRLVGATIVAPVSAARRWRDRPPAGWHVTIEGRLPRSAFRPRPRVDCCVLRLRRAPPRRR